MYVVKRSGAAQAQEQKRGFAYTVCLVSGIACQILAPPLLQCLLLDDRTLSDDLVVVRHQINVDFSLFDLRGSSAHLV